MKPLHRSLLGALVAVASIPVFLGLQACIPTFPVPLGDPEKSRIDPAITGVWLMAEEEYIYLFEAYDKRTWLVSGYDIYDDDREECADADTGEGAGDTDGVGPYDAFMAGIAARGPKCFDLDGGPGAKAWRTRLGGEWFMTWQSVGYYDHELGFGRDEYLLWRLDLSVPGELRLWMFQDEHEAWDALPEDDAAVSRRAFERIIRRNADDPTLYDDEPAILYRVLPEHLGLIGEVFRHSDYDPDW